MGIVGLPNVGKSSLFNLLGENITVAAENFPFCTIDPNKARCAVPDDRFQYLCDTYKSPSQIPAYLHLVDIAGLIKGASEGAGLGNAFLSHIQAVDGIFHMLRAFDSKDVIHVDDSVDPVRDLETITGELCAKDRTYVAKMREEKETLAKRDKTIKLEPIWFETMDKVKELLEENQPLGKVTWENAQIHIINDVIPGCITTKPMIYLVNISKKAYIRGGNKYFEKIKAWVKSHGGGKVIPVSVQFEEEWAAHKRDGDMEELTKLTEATGGRGSMLHKIIKAGYKQLHLDYYFTAGEKEVRCWTIMKGVTAPQAAGVIHTDFQRGFIKAECVSFDDFKALHGGAANMTAVKAGGKYRSEGKNYIVQNGDIIEFKFNVTKGTKK